MTLVFVIVGIVTACSFGFLGGCLWASCFGNKPIDKGSEHYITILKSFYDLCQRHDWRYADSDDHRKYTDGYAQAEIIYDLMERYPVLRPVYDAWHDYAFKGSNHPSIAFFL